MDIPPTQDPVSQTLAIEVVDPEVSNAKKNEWQELLNGKTMLYFYGSFAIGILCLIVTIGLWIEEIGSKGDGAYVAVGVFAMMTLCALCVCGTMLCEIGCPKSGKRAYSRVGLVS